MSSWPRWPFNKLQLTFNYLHIYIHLFDYVKSQETNKWDINGKDVVNHSYKLAHCKLPNTKNPQSFHVAMQIKLFACFGHFPNEGTKIGLIQILNIPTTFHMEQKGMSVYDDHCLWCLLINLILIFFQNWKEQNNSMIKYESWLSKRNSLWTGRFYACFLLCWVAKVSGVEK